jgi:amidophosphoribosyltransferase
VFPKLKEECGVFGIYGHPEAANLTYLGLYTLQHRGQEGAGIVSSDGQQLYVQKGMGLVADVFTEENLQALCGSTAIGHVRYSTSGESSLKNVQPLVVDYAEGSVAIAHNGNLVNTQFIRESLEAEGVTFQTTLDTEVIVNLLARSGQEEFLPALIYSLARVRGAYTLLIITDNELMGMRDPQGFRPLCLGRLDGAYILASESCALDLLEAEFIRDIEPGELVVINQRGLTSQKPFPPQAEAFCIFEYIYFARPDSDINGLNVTLVRKRLGQQLAREKPVEADVVIPVPDSGVGAALGYSEESGIPFIEGLIRNHYVGRTFIEPRQSIRHFGVKVKLNAVKKLLADKRVIVIDDSIVRGTTSRKIIKMIRRAGAREIHMRVSSPPNKYPCFYGIDTPTRQELIAATHQISEISRYLTTDSLGYLSVEGMLEAVHPLGDRVCTACFTGKYPIKFPMKRWQQLGLFEKL